MFDRAMIQSLQQQAAEQKWSYPQLFEALKAAGVASYVVSDT